ncbi:hypothetical protein ABPG72_000535 [Tetrahymena utriculariae]
MKIICAFKQHQCKHDQDEKIQQQQVSVQKYFKENQKIQQNDKNRMLDVINLQPIKISSDFSQFQQQGGDITNNQRDYLISVSNTVINFVQNFIKVQPNPTTNIYDPEQSQDGTCLGYQVPSQDQIDGIANSDLHLYFVYVNNSTLRFLASAGFCNLQQTDNYIRPNFGLVEFNVANLVNEGSDLQQYQKDVQVILHEIIHVLRFSYSAMINWFNKTSHSLIGEDAKSYVTNQVLRQYPINILGSPNVQATARNSGFENSHWERTVIRTELMTASSLTEGLHLTIFTVALLKDTGYWDEVNQNLTHQVFWGYNKGCDFFLNACQSSTQTYEEFTTQNSQFACSFWSDGQVICSINEQGKQINAVYNQVILGQITCPQDIKKFCQNKQCANLCAYKGICIRGMCLCNQGFGGVDCSIKCVGYINSSGLCVNKCPSKTFANFDNVCRQTCPDGTYPNLNQGLCQQCNFSCSKYIGPNKNQCTSCQFLTYLYQSTCMLTCPYKTFADEQSKICQPCLKGCSLCNSANFCSQCDIGFKKFENICKSTNCSYPCATCSSDSQNCQSCLDNRYFYNNTCISYCPLGFFKNNSTLSCSSCSIGCISCLDASLCTEYDTQKGYRLQGSMCTQCDFLCAACSQYDSTYCLSCENNYYLFNNTCTTTCPNNFYKGNNLVCSLCQSGCQTCQNINQCIECTEGYQFYEQNNMQICINSNNCQSPCLSCSNLHPNTCISCDQNYFLQNSTCVKICIQGFYAEDSTKKCIQCFPNCSTCQGSPNNCNSCDQSSYLLENSCYSKCPTGYTYSNYLCVLTRALNMKFIAYFIILNIIF